MTRSSPIFQSSIIPFFPSLCRFLRYPFKWAVEFSVAGPAFGVEFARGVQVIGVVAFMDADGFLLPVPTKKGLKTGGPLLGLRDAAVAVILTERIVSHLNIIKCPASFCQMEKNGKKRGQKDSDQAA